MGVLSIRLTPEAEGTSHLDSRDSTIHAKNTLTALSSFSFEGWEKSTDRLRVLDHHKAEGKADLTEASPVMLGCSNTPYVLTGNKSVGIWACFGRFMAEDANDTISYGVE